MDIEITPRALEKVRSIASKDGVDLAHTFLRVAVVPGGCSGLTYDLGWDTVANADDEEGLAEGVRVLVDARSYAYIEGSALDFSDGLEGKGFFFANPQAIRTCACGESFGL